MKIKRRSNVKFENLRKEALVGWINVIYVAINYGIIESITITSGFRLRKKGEKFSFHHVGLAFDFITNPLNYHQRQEFERMLYLQLGPHYDIIYHQDRNGKGQHWHVEYDRKEK